MMHDASMPLWGPWTFAVVCCGLLAITIAALMTYKQRAARAEAHIASLQANAMAASAKQRAEHPDPGALVQTLLDMLQNGEIPPDQDLDMLRGILVENQEANLPLSLEESSIEPFVEDSILFTLGQRPPFPVMETPSGNTCDQETQDHSLERETEAALYERILSQLSQEQSIFDSSGLRAKRTCLLEVKPHALLSKSCSSSSNQQSDAQNTQPGGADVAFDGDSPKSEDFLSRSQAGRRSGALDLFCGAQPIQPVSSRSMGSMLRRRGRSASDTNSRRDSSPDGRDEAAPWMPSRMPTRLSLTQSSSRLSLLAGGDVAAPDKTKELQKSTSDGLFGFLRPKAFCNSMSSCSHGSRGGEGQGQQPQQQQQQQPPGEKAEAEEQCGPSCSKLQAPLTDEVHRLLAQADTSFFFDAFALNDATSGHALSVLGFFLLNRTGLTSIFKINLPRLAQFLRKIEAGMNAIPYHNTIHVADVLQMLHALSALGGLSAAIADPLYMLSAYLAAVIHDFEHAGLTNAFLIATESPLAMRYNDTAPLEQHHLSSAFVLMKDHDLMPTLPKAEFLRLRRAVIDMVLATDMAKHVEIMGRLTALAASVSSGGMSRKQSSQSSKPSPLVSPFTPVATLPLRSARSTPPLTNPATFPTLKGSAEDPDSDSNHGSSQLVLDDGKKILLLQAALKCADLGHMAESKDVHSRWVSRLEEELFQQGDQEKAMGLSVSPLCDRSHPGITKTQESFINLVVTPLFHAYTRVLPDARPMLTAIKANSRFWAGQNA